MCALLPFMGVAVEHNSIDSTLKNISCSKLSFLLACQSFLNPPPSQLPAVIATRLSHREKTCKAKSCLCSFNIKKKAKPEQNKTAREKKEHFLMLFSYAAQYMASL